MDQRKQYEKMRRLEPDFYVDRFEATRPKKKNRWTSGLIEVVTIVSLFVLVGLCWYAAEKNVVEAIDQKAELYR